LTSVLYLRAILRASIRVATPELSICVIPDKSMLTIFGCGVSNSARSQRRTAGEESISIRPYKDANAPLLLATIFIPDFSISLLLLGTESGPFQHNVYARTPSSELRIDTRNRNSSA